MGVVSSSKQPSFCSVSQQRHTFVMVSGKSHVFGVSYSKFSLLLYIKLKTEPFLCDSLYLSHASRSAHVAGDRRRPRVVTRRRRAKSSNLRNCHPGRQEDPPNVQEGHGLILAWMTVAGTSDGFLVGNRFLSPPDVMDWAAASGAPSWGAGRAAVASDPARLCCLSRALRPPPPPQTPRRGSRISPRGWSSGGGRRERPEVGGGPARRPAAAARRPAPSTGAGPTSAGAWSTTGGTGSARCTPRRRWWSSAARSSASASNAAGTGTISSNPCTERRTYRIIQQFLC
jgi:hypothetical protein